MRYIFDPIFLGDFFRKVWGPYAGWAQSVSKTVQLSSDNNI